MVIKIFIGLLIVAAIVVLFVVFYLIVSHSKEKNYLKVSKELLEDYSFFGEGVGMGVSAYTIVEIFKGNLTINLIVVFFGGIIVFECSRQLKKYLKKHKS